MTNKLSIEMELDYDKYTKDLEKTELKARDTGEKIDKNLMTKLELDVADLEIAKKKARELVKINKELYESGRLPYKDYQKAVAGLNKVSSATTEAKRRLQNYRNTGEIEVSRLQKKFNGLGASIKNMAVSFVKFTGLYLIFDKIKQSLGDMEEKARSVETAFAGFRKTLNATETELKNIEKGIMSMTKRLPMTAEELAKIAEIGGQMGIESKNILKFTETVAKLSTAIDGISSEEAAQIMARLLAQTGQSIENIDRLGASLVGLGNNFKANEGEILNFANEIKSAGGVVGQTSQDILGISTAFVDAGINAEAGGTAVSKALLIINDAVKQGGYELEQFASLSGKSVEQFKKDWTSDSANAFANILEGIKNKGDEANKTIDEMFGTDIRLKKAFLAVANSGDTLRKSIKMANNEFDRGTALQNEFLKRLQTTDSQLQLNSNRWDNYTIGIGQNLSQMKLWLSNLFLNVFPGFLAGMQGLLAGLYFGVRQAGIRIKYGLNIAGIEFKKAVSFMVDLFSVGKDNMIIIAGNIGESFKLIPKYFLKSIEKFRQGLESMVNLGSTAVNKIAGMFGKSNLVGRISIGGRIDYNQYEPQYKALKEFTSKSKQKYDELEKNIKSNYKERQVYEKAYYKEVFKQITEEAEKASKTETIKQELSKISEKQKKKDLATQQKSIKTIDILNNKLSDLRKKLKGTEIGSKYFNILKKEITKTEKELAKANKTGGKYNKTIDLQKKLQEEYNKKIKIRVKLEKEVSKSLKEQETRFKKGKNIMQGFYEDMLKRVDKVAKRVENLKNKQEDLNKQLKGVEKEKDVKLAERQLEIEKELAELKNNPEDIDKKKKLEEELAFIKLNVNQKVLEEIRRQSQLSESERIVEEYDMKKKELKNKLKLVRKNLKSEEKLYKKLVVAKTNFETYFTGFIKQETQKRMNEHQAMLEQARSIAAEMSALGFTGSGFKATFSKVVSDDKGNSKIITENKVINYNTINQNNTIKNNVDMYKAGKEIVRQIGNNQTGISNKTISK